MTNKILIVDDDVNICQLLNLYLTKDGFSTTICHNGENAIQLVEHNKFDLILLDIMMPVLDGFQTLAAIRKMSTVPVILVSAKGEPMDKISGLDIGADDYVTKPFDTLELIARIKRNIARYGGHSHPPGDNLTIDKDSYRAHIGGHEIPLTKTEFEILSYLHESANKVRTRDEIIHAVFGDFYGESNIVDANIKNIRAKIQKHTAKQIIETVRGKGYVIRHD